MSGQMVFLTRSVFVEKVVAFFVVSRAEFIPAGFSIVGVPMLLAAAQPADLAVNLRRITLGAAVGYLAYSMVAQVNCLADYQLDQLYKSRLPRAIDVLGSGTIWWLMAIETLLASALVVYLTLDTSRIILLILWIIGAILAAAYSLEPFRFKRRGLLNLLNLGLVLYLLPSLFIYYLIAPTMKSLPLLALIGFGTQMLGLLLVNEIEDYHEDKQMRVLNPCVKWGLKKAALASVLFTGVTGIALMVLFILFARNIYVFIGVAVMVITYAVITVQLYKLYKSSAIWEATGATAAAAEVRRLAAQSPIFFLMSGIPLLLVSGLNVFAS